MEISLTDALPIPFALDQASSDQTYDFRGMAPRRATGFASDQMRASKSDTGGSTERPFQTIEQGMPDRFSQPAVTMFVGFPFPREAAASGRIPCSVIRGRRPEKLGHLVLRQSHAKSGLAGRFVFAAERTGKLTCSAARSRSMVCRLTGSVSVSCSFLKCAILRSATVLSTSSLVGFRTVADA
jgi:hypothetical protein